MKTSKSTNEINFNKILKRDGKQVEFNKQKIVNAILKAGHATGEFEVEVAQKLADDAIKIMNENFYGEILSVEDVQDFVEKALIHSGYDDTAKAYILYREKHAEIRAIALAASLGMIDSYVSNIDWQVKENSNMTYSLQGLNNHIFSEVTKNYWLHKIYPENIQKASESGDFHIHDMGSLSVYCVGWDLMDLLREGFCGVSGKVQSGPAKHLRSALGQIVNFMYTLQGEAAGAIAFSNFDTLLAPFIRYDNIDRKEIRQCLQEFVFNMNVPTRVGFQSPFSNITLDLTVSPNFKNQKVVIGGVDQKETYADFQEEMYILNEELFKVLQEGDASGRVFSFPIPTVNITKDFKWNDPRLTGLWEMTAKYGIPYFSNFINSDMKPEDTRSMCCRLRLDLDELDKRGGGLFGSNALTGSIGVVTINLPRIGFNAKTEKEFFEILFEKMDLARESLEIKRKIIEKFAAANLYPYTSHYLRNVYKAYGEYWKNHFSTIGLVGMNEACLNFLGEDIGTKKGKVFAEKVLTKMRERLIGYQKETGNLYNLEATPAEGTAFRLALKDKAKYPNIIVANEDHYKKGAKPFYTNSTHLPVNYTDDIFEALDIQDDLQTKYTGGTVMHLFLGEKIADASSVPGLVKKICENFHLPYFTFTPTFSVCQSHGYIGGERHKCDKCNSDCEVYSRIVGYLRPVDAWNDGKKEEWKNRKTYEVSSISNAKDKSKNKVKTQL